MLVTNSINLPLNRVEGDMEVRVTIKDGLVADAWCAGTMYRGFERILIGRGAMDGLVITPRICGICTTCHLLAAAQALDMIGNITPPPDALRLRYVTLLSEHIQSDVRHAILMYAADFANPAHRDCPLFPEAVRRYAPLQGSSARETLQETKKVLEIVALIGGQWPHSSYMVPGGMVSVPNKSDLTQCRLLLAQYRHWYETKILGCSLERWHTIQSEADLETWLQETEPHRESDLGFYLRFARAIGLDKIGRGHNNFLCYGYGPGRNLSGSFVEQGIPVFFPAGFARGNEMTALDQKLVTEQVATSWFIDYPGGKHPSEGETQPYASGQESKKYSWAKAPRYQNLPAETGPLAEMVIARHPLFGDLLQRHGPNALVRELARFSRPAQLIPVIEKFLKETNADGIFYQALPEKLSSGQGFGLVQAARGALGHWVQIENGLIKRYQIITPTAWNSSPRDSQGVRGPIEQALIGTPIKDPANPVEIGHVVRSFDACLVCTVH